MNKFMTIGTSDGYIRVARESVVAFQDIGNGDSLVHISNGKSFVVYEPAPEYFENNLLYGCDEGCVE